jgi:hypothetical protein
MKRLLAFFLLTTTALRADPLITSWLTSISEKYARIYTSTGNRTSGTSATTWTGSNASQTSPAYAGVNEIDASTNWVYIKSTGLGGHVMGPWNNPNSPKNQSVLWRFPRTPTVPIGSNRISTALTSMGAIGFLVDGVAAYNTSDGFSYSYTNTKDATPNGGIGNGDGIWNRDAFVNEAVSFDYALAHNQPSGEYHYHVNPIATRYLAGDNVLYNSSTKNYAENTAAAIFPHSPIIGWMKDGLPLYGAYGYDGGGTGGTSTANLSGTSVSTVTVNTGGTYMATPQVSFSGGGGSGAAALAVMQVIAAIPGSSGGGSGYKVGDVLTVTGGAQTVVATLTVATITGNGSTGPIGTLTVSQGGTYSVIPPNYVSVSGGTGTGATPILTWAVSAINVTGGGTGYTSAPTVTIGGVRRMLSGYQLRDGTNGTTNLSAINAAVSTSTGRTSLPQWALTSQNRAQLSTASQYGPAVNSTSGSGATLITYTLGHYAEDYDYLGDLGFTQGSLANAGGVMFDLNEYNTRFCITPDYPNGTWAYFTTIKSDGTSFFPYGAGRWYRGNPTVGGGSTTTGILSADGATPQVLAGANTALTIGTPSAAGGTVTLTWSSVEGGTYSVDGSTNQTTWTSEKTALAPTNIPVAPTVGNAAVMTATSYNTIGSFGTEYARVNRTALATYDSAGQTTATVAQSTIASYSAGTPAALTVTPSTGLTAGGSAGGPFSPPSATFTLQNTGTASMNWTAGNTTNWLSLDNTGGTLAGGATDTATATINANANSLPTGGQSDTITFTNSTNGSGNTTRTVNLTVVSTNATLSNLALSSGTLSPSFASGTTSYTATVSNATSSITLTPTLADGNATVQVNGVTAASGIASGAIALAVGSNSIGTVVTAQDGVTTKTYAVIVTRQTAAQSWQQTWYSSTSNSNAVLTAAAYNTGLTNLEVFAFFGPNQNPALALISQLPQVQIGGSNIYFSFTQPVGVSGMNYGAQWCSSLQSAWNTIADTGSSMQHIFSVPVGSNATMFLRLTVTGQ